MAMFTVQLPSHWFAHLRHVRFFHAVWTEFQIWPGRVVMCLKGRLLTPVCEFVLSKIFILNFNLIPLGKMKHKVDMWGDGSNSATQTVLQWCGIIFRRCPPPMKWGDWKARLHFPKRFLPPPSSILRQYEMIRWAHTRSTIFHSVNTMPTWRCLFWVHATPHRVLCKCMSHHRCGAFTLEVTFGFVMWTSI